MSNIVIVGNSLAALSAIQEIRRQDQTVDITLLCPEACLPYDRIQLPLFLSKEVRESHIHPHHDKFFNEHKVELILNEPLSRISTKRKYITTENKTQIHFDKLLITDLVHVKLPEIKGVQKEGVFDHGRLKTIKELIKFLPFADQYIVSVSTFSGFNTACALKRLGKEVLIVTAKGGLLAEVLDDESAVLLKQIAETQGLRVMSDNTIEEILGDAQVKAVRLKSGKVIAAEAVVFDNARPDVKFFAESGLLDEQEQFHVGSYFNTLLPDVFACESLLGSFDCSLEEAIEQGRTAAMNMLKSDGLEYQVPMNFRLFGHKICNGFCGGNVRLIDGGRERMSFDGPENVYKKIFLFNDCLVGAVCFNVLNEKDKIRKALEQIVSLIGCEDQFLQTSSIGQ